MAPEPGSPTHLFVYGTLRPGEVRWHFLEPFVVDEGVDTTVPGEIGRASCRERVSYHV